MAGTAPERLLLYRQRELQGAHSLAFAKKLASSTFYVTRAVSGGQRAGKLMHSARAPRVLLRGVSSEPCAEQHSSVLQNHPKTLFYSHNHRHQVTVGTRRPYALPTWCVLRGVWV